MTGKVHRAFFEESATFRCKADGCAGNRDAEAPQRALPYSGRSPDPANSRSEGAEGPSKNVSRRDSYKGIIMVVSRRFVETEGSRHGCRVDPA